MNTKEINSILERLLSPVKVKFLGVFPRDLMPKPRDLKVFPTCFVINSDPAREPGSHWIAIYYENPESCEFYDSYGYDYKMYGITSNSLPPHVISNTKQVQCFSSTVCGQHCIYYLYKRCLGLSMFQILRRFSLTNHRGNDLFVAHFVNKHSRKQISFHVCSNSSPLDIMQHSISRS